MFMDPMRLIATCNLQSTDSVADFGAGSGFIARALAKQVPQGQVFAIEINRDLVTRLTREATDMHLTNIHPIWGDIEIAGGSKLATDSVHFVVLSNVMFHLEDKQGCLKEVYRVVKTGGRVLVVDWQESYGGMGPAPHQIVTSQMTEELFARAGFTKISDSLSGGDHHYAILFKK